jgi:hypothetical protein
MIKSSLNKIELYHLERLIENRYGIPTIETRQEIVKNIVKKNQEIKRDLKASIEDLSNYTPSSFNPYTRFGSNPLFQGIRKPKRFSKNKNFKTKSEFMQKIEPQKKILRVPEARLPPRLSYLTPVNTGENIDLGKLNPFVKDNNVNSIEVDGAGKNVFVSGIMGKKKTALVLDNNEIQGIIDAFSSNAKIPISDGINKIAFGSLLLTAIVSDEIDKRFSLKKIEKTETNSSGVRVGGNMKRRVY